MKQSLLVLVFVASYVQATAINNAKQYMNNQVIIAFDLHEVVFRFSYAKFFNAVGKFFWKNPYALTLANPVAGYRFYRTYTHHAKTAENIYEKLTQNYYPWLEHSKGEFIAICNSYILDIQMKKLLEDLKKQGYRLAICSNIGYHAFACFQQEHAEFFELFDVIVTSHPEKGYMRKPSPEFFNEFKRQVERVVREPRYYIFIDDKVRNAQAAQACEIHGIVFTHSDQLRRSLKQHGITC